MDLRGKRVSLGEQASGTLVVARVILDGYGLSEDDVDASYDKFSGCSSTIFNRQAFPSLSP